MKLSPNSKILTILLFVFVVCGVLLSPLGFETRASVFFSNSASLPWLGLGFGGLILNIVSLILVFFKPRVASIVATIGSIGSIILFLSDQAGLAVSISPPLVITNLEIITTVILVAVIFFASRVFRQTHPILE